MKDTLTVIRRAAEALSRGQLIILPTETVYGLGADAENPEAAALIYRLKGRPSHNPLIVHVHDLSVASHYGDLNATARRLGDVFWPGPLTLVVKRKEQCTLASAVSAGGDTVALRAPSHPLARALLAEFGRGVAAPSANRSGRISPTSAAHAAAEFSPLPPEIALILDGGPCQVGIESTVVDCTQETPVILRPGSVTREMIEAALCRPISLTGDPSSHLKSPGQLESHYAPSLPVRLNIRETYAGEALLAFGPHALQAKKVLNLSETGDIQEAAANLFSHLRALDTAEFSGIAVMSVPEIGIGIAINDRLRRAAAKKV